MYASPTKVKAIHDLAPEQQKALNVLLNNLHRVSELYLQSDSPPSKFSTTGFMAFSNKPLPKLPHEETWIWNQSNGKVTVKTERGNYVTLQKLNTRKKKNCPKPPSYKVWMCYLTRSVHQAHYLNFIWCEKGANPKDSSSSASPDSNRSESSDGSSDNTPPESACTQFEQSSPSETLATFNSIRRASVPCVAPNSQNFITFASPCVATQPSNSIEYPSQVSQPFRSDSHLPSLEELVLLRKNEDGNSPQPTRKRSLPQVMINPKKRKFSHPTVSANISLPPLRIPNTSNTPLAIKFANPAQEEKVFAGNGQG